MTVRSRHVTEDMAMLTGTVAADGERRLVDLFVLDDGREAAVLRHFTAAGDVNSFHLTEDEDPEATDVHVALFVNLYDDTADIIDWYMPRDAAEQLILTFIAAL